MFLTFDNKSWFHLALKYRAVGAMMIFLFFSGIPAILYCIFTVTFSAIECHGSKQAVYLLLELCG